VCRVFTVCRMYRSSSMVGGRWYKLCVEYRGSSMVGGKCLEDRMFDDW
jgi:hypothetical protein